MSMRKAERRDDWLTYLALALIALFFGGPLLWILSLSLRSQAEILVTTINPIPKSPSLDNYGEVLRSAQFPRFLGLSPAQRCALLGTHGEIFDVEWWQAIQARLREGAFADVPPYPEGVRMR